MTWESFGPNAGLIAELHSLYMQDRALVGPEWAAYFDSLGGASPNAGGAPVSKGTNGTHAVIAPTAAPASNVGAQLADGYRRYGHYSARINPLSQVAGPAMPVPLELSLETYGVELNGGSPAIAPVTVGGDTFTDLLSLTRKLETIYRGSVGFEFMHLSSGAQREWLKERIENRFPGQVAASPDVRRRAMRFVMRAELFESELHRKYVGTKRFSLEGGESLIALLDRLLQHASSSGVRDAVFGMAHRGRLNVLANILGKPLSDLFSEFEDQSLTTVLGAGDVKYHLGFENTWRSGDDSRGVGVRMVPNPSHLEFVNPVVEGVVKALQDLAPQEPRNSVLPILLHGDAAFAGQGVVFETLNFSAVEGYATGGTVHVIINNQIGFTTTPDEARSTAYCTDMAKGVDAPVFHVNGDDVDACCWVAELALDYRQKFGRDVLIDLYCYRKYGHNEGDDPSFTQPLTYAEIKTKRPVYQSYAEKLIGEGVVSADDLKHEVESYKGEFERAQAAESRKVFGDACPMHGRLRIPCADTAVDRTTLERIARSLVKLPEGFVAHPKLLKILEKRVESVIDGAGIEWGMAEVLAFGSLVLEGIPVRLSGQDCGRGTFSQRHIVLDHYEAPAVFSPLKALAAEAGCGSFEVLNSTLSEAAVMGFEFGYSATRTDALVMWEGQFGDFANGAQVIIDQFIASSEAKWGQLSGVTLLLPHGYEGQGPEHSSARLERYLQLCGEGNMMVCYPSTAGQHFHLLRNQGLMQIKRPLVVMTPKSLLRLPAAAAVRSDLTEGCWKPVLENDFGQGTPTTIVMTSGKVYHDLAAALEKADLKGNAVRVLRIEQLHPFPQFEFKKALQELGKAQYLWLQEEPANMGAWSYIQPYLTQKLGLDVTYIGRDASASPATGSPKFHAKEQQAIVSRTIELAANRGSR
jgi:2-oxoglutarate dehydrogenase E1 component